MRANCRRDSPRARLSRIERADRPWLLSGHRSLARLAHPAQLQGLEGGSSLALRSMAARSRVRQLARGLEKRVLLEFRLRDAIDARRASRRSPRFRRAPAPLARPTRRCACGRSRPCAQGSDPGTNWKTQLTANRASRRELTDARCKQKTRPPSRRKKRRACHRSIRCRGYRSRRFARRRRSPRSFRRRSPIGA